MKYALLNPNWRFDGSIYFGCREAHLPLEFGYAKGLLERAGHEALIVDAQLFDLAAEQIVARVESFAPGVTVVTTAPSYLFWRCAPPELRMPLLLIEQVRSVAGRLAAVGPHGSTTPRAALEKLGVELVVMGECEEILPRLAEEDWRRVPSICWRNGDELRIQGGPWAGAFSDLPALHWPDEWISRHDHHHHRFDAAAEGPGAEVEASRGCPYNCSFCAKIDFRDKYRRRSLPALLEEIDGLARQGVGYLYFIDEIFLPNRPLLEALVGRRLKFGVQTRIDLWKPDMLALLGQAGCVSIEAGVESLSMEGRAALDKDCKLTTEELCDRLIEAKRHVAFVQANLIAAGGDQPDEVARWRDNLRRHGVWANDPVPLFPYPGSPDYRKRWGPPDQRAWERAHDHYLAEWERFSDIQDERPLPLPELELAR
jgi:B12-binding domain/radical SAM domain protein of rhizo-twelve system